MVLKVSGSVLRAWGLACSGLGSLKIPDPGTPPTKLGRRTDVETSQLVFLFCISL